MQLTQLPDRYCRFPASGDGESYETERCSTSVTLLKTLALGDFALETQRIEAKFSRYRRDNVIFQINTAQGQPVTLDEETANLMDFAAQLHALSGRPFRHNVGPVTPGMEIRRIRPPSSSRSNQRTSCPTWHKVHWRRPILQLQPAWKSISVASPRKYAVDRFSLCWPKAVIGASTPAPFW